MDVALSYMRNEMGVALVNKYRGAIDAFLYIIFVICNFQIDRYSMYKYVEALAEALQGRVFSWQLFTC